MSRSHPPDVVVLDTDGLLHARVARGRTAPQLQRARSFRLPEGTFAPSVVTPSLANEAALAEALRRLKLEAGKIDQVSLLIPDAWFRMNIVELPSLPEKSAEAKQVVNWSLKRTLPIEPESLRVAYDVLSKTPTGGVKVFILSAVDATLAAIERVFTAAGLEVVLIEPIGLNVWNAVTVREQATTRDRLFLYVRDTDFTTAVFRGAQPMFIRSRNFSGDRTLQQEIRLSASYLRDMLQGGLETCWLAGNALAADVADVVTSEFNAPVRRVELRQLVSELPPDVGTFETELAACTGVFTA